jgi:hypothetical protein
MVNSKLAASSVGTAVAVAVAAAVGSGVALAGMAVGGRLVALGAAVAVLVGAGAGAEQALTNTAISRSADKTVKVVFLGFIFLPMVLYAAESWTQLMA